jgi:superfamily II DNA/RNA helicase
MKQPAIIEVDELSDTAVETHEQLLYNVPNFGTKLNLLNLFMYDEELFTKTVVFVNTQTTAEKLFQSLKSRLRTGVAYLNPKFFDTKGFKNVADFKAETGARVLIVTNENEEELDLSGVPFLIHFDLPADNELFLSRIVNQDPDNKEETLAMTFATDIELSQVKKIEQLIGNKIPVAELPEDLVILTESKPKKAEIKEDAKPAGVGEAFHEKKASNAKTYNLSASTKAKMNKKKKHG